MKIQDRLRDVAISDSGFLFDPYTGLTFSVNVTARFILARLTRGEAPEAIEVAVQEHFAVAAGDDVGRDVRELLLQLRENGLVPPDETP